VQSKFYYLQTFFIRARVSNRQASYVSVYNRKWIRLENYDKWPLATFAV
jgi:hypothetical protein